MGSKRVPVLALAAIVAGCSPSSGVSGTGVVGSLHRAAQPAALTKVLYVADYGDGSIDVLVHRRLARSITDGVNGPQDVTLDANGNVYVVNTTGDNVTEYAPDASQPAFVYNAGMVFPATVAVDREGDVYEADQQNRTGASVLNEYAQGSNVVLHSCAVQGKLVGVALDAQENVFVSSIVSGGNGIAEYAGGLANGCVATVEPLKVYAPGGMVIDDNGAIVLADQNSERIDVIPPPYDRITKKTGYRLQDPYHVSIDKSNRQIYVTDAMKDAVFLFSYPRLKLEVAMRHSNDHFGVPLGAVGSPNEVH